VGWEENKIGSSRASWSRARIGQAIQRAGRPAKELKINSPAFRRKGAGGKRRRGARHDALTKIAKAEKHRSRRPSAEWKLAERKCETVLAAAAAARATPKFSKSLPSGGRKRTRLVFLPVELDEATLDEAVSARRHRARDHHDSAAECELRERAGHRRRLDVDITHALERRSLTSAFSFRSEFSQLPACLLLSFLFSRPSTRSAAAVASFAFAI
jgi:hypothetical protein